MTKILAKTFPGRMPLSLQEHTNHVLEAWSALWAQISQSLGAQLGVDSELIDVLMRFCITHHDLGKVLPAFQVRILGNASYPHPEAWYNVPHSLASPLWLDKTRYEALIERLKQKEADAPWEAILLAVIAYHHWRERFFQILLREESDLSALAWALLTDADFRDRLTQALAHEMGTDFALNLPLAQALAAGTTLAQLVPPPYSTVFLPYRITFLPLSLRIWLLLAGFLQKCDHYASWCEAANYPLTKIEIPPLPREKVYQAITTQLGRTTYWQKTYLEKITNAPNLVLLAPTGVGKTEFAFLYSAGTKLIYTLPLRVAVNQTYERAKRVYGEDQVGLLHGDADLYLYRQIEDVPEVLRTYELTRHLGFPVLVTTGDQIFPYALRPPGFERIYATLTYTTLVIDEIQAYDPEASAIVVKLLRDIQQLGGRFLLMTATMPKFVLERLLPTSAAHTPNSPAILNFYKEEKTILSKIIKHKIRLVPVETSSDEDLRTQDPLLDRLLKDALNLAQQGKRVLVVLNTVAAAQALYQKTRDSVKEKPIPVHLVHSRFAEVDRTKHERAVTNAFSNPRPPEEKTGKIAITTQVVEAALDLDADVLLTPIAPLDSLLQRMGRVARRYYLADGQLIDGSTKQKYPLTQPIDLTTLYNDGQPNVYVYLPLKPPDKKASKKAPKWHLDPRHTTSVYRHQMLLYTSYLWLWAAAKGNTNHLKDWETEKTSLVANLLQPFFLPETSPEEFWLRLRKALQSRGGLEIPNSFVPQDQIDFSLSEYDKYPWLELFYAIIAEEGSYIEAFNKTIDVLEAGWVSEKSAEAAQIFRHFTDISILPAEIKDGPTSILKAIAQHLREKPTLSYLELKDQVLSQYVINVSPHGKFSPVWPHLQEELGDELPLLAKESWFRGLYYGADWVYDREVGLLPKQNQNKGTTPQEAYYEFL